MAKSIFLDKALQPDEHMLAAALGGHMQYWDEIIRHLSENYKDFSGEWKYYGKAWGWSLVLKSRVKTLCYLTPASGYPLASFIFNDRGRALAAKAELSEEAARAVEDSKDNPKNIPFDFPVMTDADIVIAKKLISVRSKT